MNYNIQAHRDSEPHVVPGGIKPNVLDVGSRKSLEKGSSNYTEQAQKIQQTLHYAYGTPFCFSDVLWQLVTVWRNGDAANFWMYRYSSAFRAICEV